MAGLICRAEDATWLYTVQLSATVQASPPQITLNWLPDEYGANSFTVYRKAKDSSSWGAGIGLSGTATSYVDNNVSEGVAYEYRVVKAARLGYTGYGYIYAGINAPLTEARGKVLLVVATNSTVGLDYELSRLQNDLTGDGWTVVRHDISSDQTPASVKSLIVNDYLADPANVRALFLFGHVPVLRSGNLNYDGHLLRPMPSDSYYGDMDGYWPTEPGASPSYLPSDVELMVGRVDMFSMPGNGAPVPWPSEVELLRNYLNKDHNWRHNLLQVKRRALMGNLRGDENGEATAASGYRNFQPLVGPGNTIEANVEYNAPADQRWISKLVAGSYLWAYGCGAGQYTAISGLGTADGTFQDVRSIDIVGQNAQAVFVMCFGSWFGEWDHTDNIMRSVLATPTTGLTCCMAGRPHWFVHHMALGETIGYSTRLSMNNSTLYQNQSNGLPRAVYVALMGDPTLRMDPVSPPANLSASVNGQTVTLSWSGSPDEVLGYHVYRAASPSGEFSRLTGSLVNATSFSDSNVSPNTYIYMVRGVQLQTTPSGTYFNPSQGIFATVAVAPASPPIEILISRTSNRLTLTWNTASASVYHVEAKNNFTGPWTNISGPLTSVGPTLSWTDNSSSTPPQRIYRVASP